MKGSDLLTRYDKERRWIPTGRADALRIISEEGGEEDPEGVLAYIQEATKRGKTVAVGRCRFRRKVTGAEPSPSS